jgi:hypothetical protein
MSFTLKEIEGEVHTTDDLWICSFGYTFCFQYVNAESDA